MIKFTKQNISNAGLSDRVEFIASYFFDPELTKYLRTKKVKAIHTDVEWTTTGIYGQDHAKNIEDTSPDTKKLFDFLKKNYVEDVCMRLPEVIQHEQLRSLADCEIEEIYKNGELMCIYVYFDKFAFRPSSKFSLSE